MSGRGEGDNLRRRHRVNTKGKNTMRFQGKDSQPSDLLPRYTIPVKQPHIFHWK